MISKVLFRLGFFYFDTPLPEPKISEEMLYNTMITCISENKVFPLHVFLEWLFFQKQKLTSVIELINQKIPKKKALSFSVIEKEFFLFYINFYCSSLGKDAFQIPDQTYSPLYLIENYPAYVYRNMRPTFLKFSLTQIFNPQKSPPPLYSPEFQFPKYSCDFVRGFSYEDVVYAVEKKYKNKHVEAITKALFHLSKVTDFLERTRKLIAKKLMKVQCQYGYTEIHFKVLARLIKTPTSLESLLSRRIISNSITLNPLLKNKHISKQDYKFVISKSGKKLYEIYLKNKEGEKKCL